jgi:hypothetical protein
MKLGSITLSDSDYVVYLSISPIHCLQFPAIAFVENLDFKAESLLLTFEINMSMIYSILSNFSQP